MKTLSRLLVLLLALAGLGICQPPDSSNPTRGDVTIASGESLSTALSVGACTPAAIVMPAVWTAASITVQMSVDSVNFYDLYDEYGTEVTVTAAAARVIRLSAGDWWIVRYLRLRSGTTGTPVNQAAARTLKVVCR